MMRMFESYNSYWERQQRALDKAVDANDRDRREVKKLKSQIEKLNSQIQQLS